MSKKPSDRINIRTAGPDDTDALKILQRKSVQGKDISISIVNEPDFFQRTGLYENSKTFLVSHKSRIIGCGTCALKKTKVNNTECLTGYSFQLSVDPEFRRQGIAVMLRKKAEDYFRETGTEIAYGIIKTDNTASKNYAEKMEIRALRHLRVRCFPAIRRSFSAPEDTTLRQCTEANLEAASALINKTWQEYSLFTETSKESLIRLFDRYPGLDLNQFYILMHGSEIRACMALRDTGKIMKVKIENLSLKMRGIGFLSSCLKPILDIPGRLKKGNEIKYAPITLVGYKSLTDFKTLLLYVRRICAASGIDQLVHVTEADHPTMEITGKMLHMDSNMNLYIRRFSNQNDIHGPVYVDGADI